MSEAVRDTAEVSRQSSPTLLPEHPALTAAREAVTKLLGFAFVEGGPFTGDEARAVLAELICIAQLVGRAGGWNAAHDALLAANEDAHERLPGWTWFTLDKGIAEAEAALRVPA